MITTCPDCGQARRVYQQMHPPRPAVTLAECKNPACDLCDVTLAAARWATISAAELDEYRAMVRKLRKAV